MKKNEKKENLNKNEKEDLKKNFDEKKKFENFEEKKNSNLKIGLELNSEIKISKDSGLIKERWNLEEESLNSQKSKLSEILKNEKKENFENFENLKKKENFENLKKKENFENFENLKKKENSENEKKTQDTPNVQNSQNSEKTQKRKKSILEKLKNFLVRDFKEDITKLTKKEKKVLFEIKKNFFKILNIISEKEIEKKYKKNLIFNNFGIKSDFNFEKNFNFKKNFFLDFFYKLEIQFINTNFVYYYKTLDNLYNFENSPQFDQKIKKKNLSKIDILENSQILKDSFINQTIQSFLKKKLNSENSENSIFSTKPLINIVRSSKVIIGNSEKKIFEKKKNLGNFGKLNKKKKEEIEDSFEKKIKEKKMENFENFKKFEKKKNETSILNLEKNENKNSENFLKKKKNKF